jgi:putative ABC transport system permease protein
MLLAGAGLLVRSFLQLQKQSLGFQTDRVAASFLLLAPNRYPDGNATTTFLEQVIARIKALPGIESAGAISTLPLSGNDARRPFTLPGQPEEAGRPNIARFRLVTPDYFQAMRIPLKRGRLFDERDRTGGAEVVIVSEGLARRFWPNEDPVGKIILVPDMQRPATRQIVGVVGDVRHYGLAEEAPIEIYRPFYQARWPFFTLVVRGIMEPVQLANSLRQAIGAVDKDQPIQSIRMMDELAYDSVALRRASMVLLAIFAAVALLLAALGIYSVMSYTVAQRTQEIGIRMALGAQQQDVLMLVTREAILLAVTGVVLGLLGAFAMTRFLATLLYGVQPTDPVTFLGVSVLLTVVALLASYLPARRAANVDPMVALRYE